MPLRTIAPPKTPFPGQSITLHDGKLSFVLFVPDAWHAPANGAVPLTVHFHGAVWFAISEHLRHGLSTPLLVANLGEGSSTYRHPFEDSARFQHWLDLTVQALRAHGAPANTHITSIDITSFSAGYGAVRELVKNPAYASLIRQIILCDSMYASVAPGNIRQPLPEQIDAWVPFARAAARGEKTFVFTCSEIATPYASSSECAAALVHRIGAKIIPVLPGSIPAANDPDFPLKARADLGNFHVWFYGGTNAPAHLTHVRHMADIYRALRHRRFSTPD